MRTAIRMALTGNWRLLGRQRCAAVTASTAIGAGLAVPRLDLFAVAALGLVVVDLLVLRPVLVRVGMEGRNLHVFCSLLLPPAARGHEHQSELQSLRHLVCRL